MEDSNQRIHNTLQGFHIPLKSPPEQTSSREWSLLKSNKEALNQELHKLLHYHSSNNQQLINLHLSHLHHPKEEWGAKADYQPQTFEQICQHFKMEEAHLLWDLLIVLWTCCILAAMNGYYMLILTLNPPCITYKLTALQISAIRYLSRHLWLHENTR